MPRVFMSYGMHGRTEEQQAASRERLRKRILEYYKDVPEEEIEFVDNSNAVTNGGRLSYLGMAIMKMDGCGAVAIEDDWRLYKGCIAEVKIARLYGIKVLWPKGFLYRTQCEK